MISCGLDLPLWVLQRNRYHGKRQYLFIESICNDPDILAQNYRYKMMYSPDYKTTTEEEVSYCASDISKQGCTFSMRQDVRLRDAYGPSLSAGKQPCLLSCQG